MPAWVRRLPVDVLAGCCCSILMYSSFGDWGLDGRWGWWISENGLSNAIVGYNVLYTNVLSPHTRKVLTRSADYIKTTTCKVLNLIAT